MFPHHTLWVCPRRFHRTNTSFCYMCIIHCKKACCLLSRFFHSTLLSSIKTCTKKYAPHRKARHKFKTSLCPFPWILGHNFWFLRPKEEKYRNELKTPLHSKASPPSLPSPVSTTNRMEEECKRSIPSLRAPGVERGHTHQSVHNLRRTPALQAARSSCSCWSPPNRSHSSYWE